MSDREEFEAAMRHRLGDLVDLSLCDNGDGEYFSWDAQVAWLIWQESRKSLEIALPVREGSDVIGKPVAWLNDAYLARGVIDGEAGEDDAGPGYIPVYRHPQNAIPTTTQIDNDDWIEWGGGKCPVADDAVIEIKLRNGEVINHLSETKILIWADRGMGTDIIAYRVIENDGREG